MSSPDPSVLDDVPPRHPASELQEALLATADIEAFLQQLTDVAVGAIGGGIAVGITVARDGHPITVACSDGYAARLDEVQYGHDEGPCLTAMRAGKNVVIDDLLTEERFSPFRPGALALGVRSSLSLPLQGGKHAVGALNLYSRRPRAFGPLEQEKAQGFANEATRNLSLAVRLADSPRRGIRCLALGVPEPQRQAARRRRGDHHHREHATAAAWPRVRGVIRADPDGRPATRRCRQRWALSTDMRHGLSSVVRDCRNRSMEGIDMSF